MSILYSCWCTGLDDGLLGVVLGVMVCSISETDKQIVGIPFLDLKNTIGKGLLVCVAIGGRIGKARCGARAVPDWEY